jgi:hypothetical protein
MDETSRDPCYDAKGSFSPRPQNGGHYRQTPALVQDVAVTERPRTGATASRESTIPYRPSWFDHASDALRRGPLPAPLGYLALFVVLAGARTIIGWIDGSYPPGTFFLIHVIDALNPIYLLLAIHLLDDLADRTFAGYRSVVRGDAALADELRFRLTTMPARSTMIFTLVGLGTGAAWLPLVNSERDLEQSLYFTSPAAIVADTLLSALLGMAMVLFAFHALRQLRMISRIYTRHTDLSIFHVGPLYALSRVTAMTAISLLVFSYLFAGWDINSLGNAVILACTLVVAILTFVVPLYGAHRLLVIEKSHRLGEVARRTEAAADLLHERLDRGDYPELASITAGLEGLDRERAVVTKSRTWPWDPETVRLLLTALLVPIVIWLITRILERVGA